MAGKDIRQVAGDRAAEAAAATEAPPGTGDQLAIRPEQTVWNAEQLAALESLGVAKNATPAELSVFLHVCRRSGLDPFRKQIYLVPKYDAKERKNRWVVITGIDGFRLIRDRAAARDGVVASYEDPVWYELSARGVREHPVIWTLGAETPPFGCKWVTLKTHPETGQVLGRYPKIVRFDAYVDTYEAGDRKGQRRLRWANDPDGMIAKCAEAGSLREAFPEDLGGLYIEEEFGDQQARGPGRRMPPTVQATVVAEPAPANGGSRPDAETVVEGVVREQANPVDGDLEEQRKAALGKIHAIFADYGLGGRDGEDRDVRVACAANFGRADEHAPLLRLTSLDQLDAFQAAAVADRLQRFVTGGGDAKAVRAKLVRMAASVRREWAKAET